MTHLTPTLLRQTVLAAGALTLLSVAVPAAMAAPQGQPTAKSKSHVTKMAQNRTERRANGNSTRRQYRGNNPKERVTTRQDRREGRNSDRRERQEDRRANSRERRDDRRADRNDRRHGQANTHRSSRHNYGHNRRYYGNNRGQYRRQYNRHSSPRYTRPARYRQRGFHTPYRSNLGISFHFGTPGYSQFRWASSAYGLYRPSYGHYASYRTRTTCRRVTIEGWHHGHRELVSVKQCSNPWDGTYIVQGSERVIACRW